VGPAAQPRRAGADSRGVRAGPRRAAGALSAAVGALHQGRAGGLRGRAHRPLRAAAPRGEHLSSWCASRPCAARRDSQARRRAQGGDRAVPRGALRLAAGLWSLSSRGRPRADQGQQARGPARLATEALRIKGAFAIAKDLAEKAEEGRPAKPAERRSGKAKPVKAAAGGAEARPRCFFTGRKKTRRSSSARARLARLCFRSRRNPVHSSCHHTSGCQGGRSPMRAAARGSAGRRRGRCALRSTDRTGSRSAPW
jgi:hypothetical protein